MGHTFGIVTNSQDGVTFKNMKAKIVNDLHEDHPDNLGSQNSPRAEGRFSGFSNPLLGDPGNGSIARFHKLKYDKLENVIEQIIEQYLRDKNWYSKVMCREALWNMYRRIAMWVKHNTEPQDGEYHRILQFIRECIRKILEPGTDKTKTLEENFSVLGGDHPTKWIIGNWEYKDGYYQVINQTGSFDLVFGHSLTYDGSITFTYGGRMGEGDTLELYINNEFVWSGSVTTSDVGTGKTEEIFIPKGESTFKWVYNSVGKIVDPWCWFDSVVVNEYVPNEDFDPNLPMCPAPYKHDYAVDWFNHFDAKVVESVMFSTKNLPKLGQFPGHFRYVSSSEEQEWELVHSVGNDELVGKENIFKFNLSNLSVTNSTKITYNFRYKKKGVIRFKYLADVDKGNGLLFFINDKQVGGEWVSNKNWLQAEFKVEPGMTYKFDWLIRKKSAKDVGKNSIYIKDIENVELIDSLGEPAPPDYDSKGSETYANNPEWVMISKQSVAKAFYQGVVDQPTKTMEWKGFTSECDGSISFSYKMGVDPIPPEMIERGTFFEEDFVNHIQTATSPHGSYVEGNNPWTFTTYTDAVGDGVKMAKTTTENEITYDLTVGDDWSELDVKGHFAINCPPRVIDHYKHVKQGNLNDLSFSFSGVRLWKKEQLVDGTWELKVANLIPGISDAKATIHLVESGYVTFDYDNNLKQSETFQVLVNGIVEFEAVGLREGEQVKVPLVKGDNTLIFRIVDSYEEKGDRQIMRIPYGYPNSKVGVWQRFPNKFGSEVKIKRNWASFGESGGGAWTNVSGNTIDYLFSLNPGAKFNYKEKVRVAPAPNDSNATRVFYEAYNNEDGTPRDGRIWMSNGWKWEKVAEGDGVFKVQGEGTHKMGITGLNIPKSAVLNFEYGAKFGGYEKLEVFANGEKVWQTNNTVLTSPGHLAYITIPPGTTDIEFVYTNLDGKQGYVTTPSIIYENPNDQCWTEGSEGWTINDGNNFTSPRQSTYSFGKTGDTSWRNIYLPPSWMKYGEYSEVLTVNPMITTTEVPCTPTTENDSINKAYIHPSSAYARSDFYARDGVYSQCTWSGHKHVQTGLLVEPKYLTKGSKLRGKFDVVSHLTDGGVKKAMVRIWFVRVNYISATHDVDVTKIELLHSQYENIGPKQNFYDLQFGDSQYFQFEEEAPKSGDYAYLFELVDLYRDSDVSASGHFYYYGFRGEQEVKTVCIPEFVESPDKTRVKVELINRDNGNIISSQIYEAGTHSIFFNYDPGMNVQVKYTLLKPNGSTGNYTLSKGRVHEWWWKYCLGGSGYYRYDDGTEIIDLPKVDSWAWLDVIRIYEKAVGVCDGTRVEVRVWHIDGNGTETLIPDEFGQQYRTFINTHWENILIEVHNQGTVVENHRMEVKFIAGCPGDVGYLKEGEFSIDETKPPDPTEAKVFNLDYTLLDPQWMGGCYASNMNVMILDGQGDIVFSKSLATEGDLKFEYKGLKIPTKNYRVLISTDQQGEVSPVTGKSYLTTFEQYYFIVGETWTPEPDPFNGQLEFYIDGVLQNTWVGEGGFYTASYPLTKGKHDFKWVFREHGTGFSWDYASLDWVRVTNWVCDSFMVTPYCEKGGGDKCIEALIKCLKKITEEKPPAVKIDKKVWLFT